MTKPRPLPPIPTRIGHSGYEDSRFCGHSVYCELKGQETALSLVALSVLGRRLDPNERALLDDLCVVLAEGDPRIWPLKIARLVASYGSDLCGIAAGSLATYQARIGPWCAVASAQMLFALTQAIEAAEQGGGMAQKAASAFLGALPGYSGFGVPFRPVDLRYVAMVDTVTRAGRHTRPHFRAMLLAVEIIRAARPKLAPNGTLSIAAALLDLGFAVDAVGPMTGLMHYPMFFANAFEGRCLQSLGLLELPDDRVDYLGPSHRESPRMNKPSGRNVGHC